MSDDEIDDDEIDDDDALIDEMKNAVAFERGTYRFPPDWRDEYDGGWPQ